MLVVTVGPDRANTLTRVNIRQLPRRLDSTYLVELALSTSNAGAADSIRPNSGSAAASTLA